MLVSEDLVVVAVFVVTSTAQSIDKRRKLISLSFEKIIWQGRVIHFSP